MLVLMKLNDVEVTEVKNIHMICMREKVLE